MAKKAKKSIDIDDKHLTTATIEDKINKTSTGLPRDIQFLGEALVKEANRINELELCIESMRKDLERVMGRMGL